MTGRQIIAYRSESDARQNAPEGSLILDARSLVSKWGFDDGAIIIDWWCENNHDLFPGNCQVPLVLLATELLIKPLIAAGNTLTPFVIETHNPIRLEEFNGEAVNTRHFKNPEALGGAIAVPKEFVLKAIELTKGMTIAQAFELGNAGRLDPLIQSVQP